MKNPFLEGNGKWSSSRLIGAFIVLNCHVVLYWAIVAVQWDVVKMLTLELLTLAGALYGINRFSNGKAHE